MSYETDPEILIINKIKDELNIDFLWMLYPTGVSLKLEALEIILKAIKENKKVNI